MKRSRFTEAQIISILNEVDAGLSVKEVSRKHGISEASFYNWKSKYGGMSANELVVVPIKRTTCSWGSVGFPCAFP